MITLVCRECNNPMVQVLAVDRLQLECRCGAVYTVTVDIIRRPTPAMREKLRQEREARVLTYHCPTCGTRLDARLKCPKCEPVTLLPDAT